jgi:hypothetical protein
VRDAKLEAERNARDLLPRRYRGKPCVLVRPENVIEMAFLNHAALPRAELHLRLFTPYRVTAGGLTLPVVGL